MRHLTHIRNFESAITELIMAISTVSTHYKYSMIEQAMISIVAQSKISNRQIPVTINTPNNKQSDNKPVTTKKCATSASDTSVIHNIQEKAQKGLMPVPKTTNYRGVIGILKDLAEIKAKNPDKVMEATKEYCRNMLFEPQLTQAVIDTVEYLGW